METGGKQMFENIKNIFKRGKKRELLKSSSKDTAKERLHLVLMQDRANVSADFLDLMRQEIIEVIKKYIDIDEEAMDVRLGSETNEDGTQGAPALYANIPIINIKDETRQMSKTNQDKQIMTNIILDKTKENNIKEEDDDKKETKEEIKEKTAEDEKKEENEINKEKSEENQKEDNKEKTKENIKEKGDKIKENKPKKEEKKNEK